MGPEPAALHEPGHTHRAAPAALDVGQRPMSPPGNTPPAFHHGGYTPQTSTRIPGGIWRSVTVAWYVPAIASEGLCLAATALTPTHRPQPGQRWHRHTQAAETRDRFSWTSAIALILDEIGPAAGLILLNAALDAVVG
jgi:hypothetical protein